MSWNETAVKQFLPDPESFLSNGGDLGALMRARDWSATPLGPTHSWPQSLRTSVSICLNSRFAILIWWGRELLMLYNDAYGQILGTKHPAALGQRGHECWPEIWDIIGPMLEGVLQRGEATRSDDLLLLLERHGYPEECYFTFSYSPIHDESGGVGGVFTPVHETTERVVGERRLGTLRELASVTGAKDERDACQRAAAVMGRNPFDLPFVCIYLLSAEDKNSADLICTAGIQSGTAASPSWMFIDDASAPVARAARAGVMTVIPAEPELAGLPGGAWGVSPREVAVVPLLLPGQSLPTGFLVVGINPRKRFTPEYQGFLELVAGQVAAGITEARAFEEERRRAQLLAELDRAKTTFFSNVSHEFRTPLTLMLGPIEEILSKPEGAVRPENRERLVIAQRNGLRLQRLVNALLDFSRIEAGRAEARYTRTDLAALTAEIASSFSSAMERAGLAFHVNCPPLSQPVYVDHEMWEKVVLNLLSNAFKYTLQGSVSVSLSERGDAVELSVSDTGTGVPENDLPRLFERFYRGESTVGRTHEGTGIGLALVHEMVRLHGGTVRAESASGRGSTFIVKLPYGKAHLPERQVRDRNTGAPGITQADLFIQEALRWLPEPSTPAGISPEEHARTSTSDAAAGATPQGRVLVVDDNADMRDYIRRILGKRYEVVLASNGQDALDKVADNVPDLVLTDIMMPVLDGFGLLRELRAQPATRPIPVIFLSARAGEEASVEGLDAGVDDYVVKPFTARELLARVGAHLTLKHERQRAHELLVQVFSQAPVAICVLRGREMFFELANANYRDLLGGKDPVGLPLREVIPDLDERTQRVLERVFESGEPFVANEFWIAFDGNGDGIPEDHWFNLIYHPLRDSDGSVPAIIGIGTDVTAQVIARRELERVNRELEEFAYVASHDLQEPLRTVQNYTQLLLRRHVPHDNVDATRYAEFIRTSIQRMEMLIRDLLSYSQAIHSQEETVAIADLSSALSDTLTVLATRIRETGATIDHDHLPRVIGDEKQLEHVFQNLIGNALKYRSPDRSPEIRVRAIRQGKEWTISVSDNGIGFDAQYADRIFGLFKRLHSSQYPGTGLGLAICKRIVERYGGRIWAESVKGEGSTFYFTLRDANRTN